MQKITWINCADAMPPDDKTPIIIRLGNRKPLHVNGKSLVSTYNSFSFKDDLKIRTFWTPYTPEKWKELNK